MSDAAERAYEVLDDVAAGANPTVAVAWAVLALVEAVETLPARLLDNDEYLRVRVETGEYDPLRVELGRMDGTGTQWLPS